MDLKGISWVGNIYQKFEAMCLEVEEVMYQDTVKYVENQVQTVGSSVKRFYSDVMQDLLPPSSVDAAKGAGVDVPLELYADLGIYMKPKVGVKEKQGKVDDRERLTEDPKITTDKKSMDPLTFHRLGLVENRFPLSQGNSAGGASRQHGKRSLSNKSNPYTRKNSNRENMSVDKKLEAISCLDKGLIRASFSERSNENLGDSGGGAPKQYGDSCLPKDTSLGTNGNSERQNIFLHEKARVVIPLYNDLTRASSICELSNENHKDCVDQQAKITTPGSVEMTGHDSVDESKYEIENASEQIPDIPDMVNSTESGASKGMDMTCSSHGSLSAEAHAADDCMSHGADFPADSFVNGNGKGQSSDSDEDFVSNSDDCNTDVYKIDFSISHEMEIIQQVDKAKLEESCILVNRDECHYLPQSERKSKSYKKKIRDVFSPRKRSMRKHEQLSICPGSDSNPNQEECAKNSMPRHTIKDADRYSTPDCCDSEWEFL
ncbi:uncharacterized protein LOC8264205 isoform X3 [Ricinus communis]|uniref:uncharacterized protein LOC8264205 isoform X3 n=1 Tax=Ricinus communis TaxID=3988 RepID=UPI000772D23E|nr:uncharacterized protein LOC8264205 isoform X3 [Ricinus communis]